MSGYGEWWAVILLGGALELDRTAFLQGMFSRPLVGGTLAGLLLGTPELGLMGGLFVELLWLMDLPVGASVPPDDTIAGILAVAFAVWTPAAWALEGRAALGVLLALPFAYLGRSLDVAVRRWNHGLADRAMRRLEQQGLPGVGRYHLLGALRFFAAGALTTAAGLGVGGALNGFVFPQLPAEAEGALNIVALLIPLVGAGALLARLGPTSHSLYFTGGFFGGAATGTGWRGWWLR